VLISSGETSAAVRRAPSSVTEVSCLPHLLLARATFSSTHSAGLVSSFLFLLTYRAISSLATGFFSSPRYEEAIKIEVVSLDYIIRVLSSDSFRN
jgi:hypothetical protein